MNGLKLSEARSLLNRLEDVLPEVYTEGDSPRFAAEVRTFGREVHAVRGTLEDYVQLESSKQEAVWKVSRGITT